MDTNKEAGPEPCLAIKAAHPFPALPALCTLPGAAGQGRNLCWPPACSRRCRICGRQRRRDGSAAPAPPHSSCPCQGGAGQPPQPPGQAAPQAVASVPFGRRTTPGRSLGHGTQLSQQTTARGEPGQCSPWGPAASLAGRAAPRGQQGPQFPHQRSSMAGSGTFSHPLAPF